MSTSTRTPRLLTGLLCTGLLGASLLLGLGGCASPAQKAHTPMTSEQFTADWREHSKPLINQGPGLSPGTTSWRVPAILGRGYYRVIKRSGEHAELIDGYRFEVDANPGKEINLMLPAYYNNVEALNEKYVIDLKPR
ncbi:MAG: hypothetical protein V4488_07020 [Pseudomonadota bacterium]